MQQSKYLAKSFPGPNNQKGAVLIVCLFILLILTVLGINSMQSSSLEEKMAHATLDRNFALQSAETAARTAETFIQGIVSVAALTGTNGLYGVNDATPSHTNVATWTSTANHVVATPTNGSLNAQYIIQQNGVIAGTTGALNLSGYGANRGTGDVTTFRITARGTGGATSGASVILRTHFGRAF